MIKDILQLGIDDQIKKLTVNGPDEDKINTWWGEYRDTHKIKSELDRKPRKVGTGTAARWIYPTIETVPWQKKIVSIAVAFLFGKPVKLILNNEDPGAEEAFAYLKGAWKDKKLDYFNRELMRTVCVETQAAELWSLTKDNGSPTRLNVQLLSVDNGDLIYPHFDAYGDMDAFSRKYVYTDIENKAVEVIETYTADLVRTFKRSTGNVWEFADRENLIGKIPAVYYKQPETEWSDVQSMIDRMEKMLSKLADTNDYFSAPVLKTWGEIAEMPEKEQDGKHLRFKTSENEDGQFLKRGDADYLTWNQSPESLKLEYEILKANINQMTHTPDISLENVKGLGALSGVALKLMFLDPIIKAMNKEEVYGSGNLRRVNLLKVMLGRMDVRQERALSGLDIGVEFQSILPENLTEVLENLTLASGGAVMSQETAVRQNPLVSDPQQEMERLGRIVEGESFV